MCLWVFDGESCMEGHQDTGCSGVARACAGPDNGPEHHRTCTHTDFLFQTPNE